MICVSAITCSKPTINQATLDPAIDTINYNATYTVICNSGYKLSGGDKMTCGASGFDQTPSCVGETHILWFLLFLVDWCRTEEITKNINHNAQQCVN